MYVGGGLRVSLPLIERMRPTPGASAGRYCPPMPQKTPAEGGTDGRSAPPRQGGQNFRKNVAIFSGTRKQWVRLAKQFSVISSQFSVFSSQFSVFSGQISGTDGAGGWQFMGRKWVCLVRQWSVISSQFSVVIRSFRFNIQPQTTRMAFPTGSGSRSRCASEMSAIE